jgi:hypothetical protein
VVFSLSALIGFWAAYFLLVPADFTLPVYFQYGKHSVVAAERPNHHRLASLEREVAGLRSRVSAGPDGGGHGNQGSGSSSSSGDGSTGTASNHATKGTHMSEGSATIISQDDWMNTHSTHAGNPNSHPTSSLPSALTSQPASSLNYVLPTGHIPPQLFAHEKVCSTFGVVNEDLEGFFDIYSILLKLL